MDITPPDWLSKRGGSLSLVPGGQSVAVIIDGKPHYELTPVPAGGRYSCEVMQTNSGRHLGNSTTYATEHDALQGAQENLRKVLGW